MTAPEVWCKAIENFVEIKDGQCSYRGGAGDGSLTAPCLLKGTSRCLLTKNKRETP